MPGLTYWQVLVEVPWDQLEVLGHKLLRDQYERSRWEAALQGTDLPEIAWPEDRPEGMSADEYSRGVDAWQRAKRVQFKG